jgi:hypothetical protein
MVNIVSEEHAASTFWAEVNGMVCRNMYVGKLLVADCLFPHPYSFLTYLGLYL